MQLQAPAHHVSPRARLLWALRSLLGWALVLAGLAVLAWLRDDPAPWLWWVVALCLVAVAAELAVEPRYRYRVHRWELSETAVATRSGWLHQQMRIAPISRVQTVDSEQGPLQRLLGLATVTVTTASAAGDVKIAQLDRAVADDLVARLTRITESTPGDAT